MAAIVVVVTYMRIQVLQFSATDSMEIARQLDRIHMVMGMHTPGTYYAEGTLGRGSRICLAC